MLRFFFFHFYYLFDYTVSLLSKNDVTQIDSFLENDGLDDYSDSFRNIDTSVISSSVQTLLEKPNEIQTSDSSKYSILDMNSVSFSSDQSIKEFCSSLLGINLNKKNSLAELNRMYSEVVSLYERRYLRNLPASLKNQSFSSVQQIRNFLENTGQGRVGIYKCELAKLFLCYAKTLSETRFSEIKSIHGQIKNKIFRPVAIQADENISGSPIIDSRFSGNSGGVDFLGFGRYKSLESIVGKEIANVDYNSLEDFQDLHGFTFECESKNDVLSLMQQYFSAELLENLVIENKDFITENDITECETIDDEFKSELRVALARSKKNSKEKKNKKGSSSRYREIKMKGFMNFTDPKNPSSQSQKTGVEVKFQLKENQNEYGDSFHSVLSYKKRLRELTRLSAIIRQDDLIHFVNAFFENLDRDLELKGKTKSDYIFELSEDLKQQGCMNFTKKTKGFSEKELALGFYRLLRKDLIAVKRNKKSQKIYFVHKNYEEGELAGIR